MFSNIQHGIPHTYTRPVLGVGYQRVGDEHLAAALPREAENQNVVVQLQRHRRQRQPRRWCRFREPRVRGDNGGRHQRHGQVGDRIPIYPIHLAALGALAVLAVALLPGLPFAEHASEGAIRRAVSKHALSSLPDWTAALPVWALSLPVPGLPTKVAVTALATLGPFSTLAALGFFATLALFTALAPFAEQPPPTLQQAPPPLPRNREEAQRQASAGAASQVSQWGLILEGIQVYLKDGWFSNALGGYIDQLNYRPGVREHFMEIGRLFAAYYKRQWMFQEYQPVEGSIFAITRNRRVVMIDVCSFNVSAPMRLEPRLEESMGPMLNAEVVASVPAPGQPRARTLPVELSPPPAASDARVPSKAPPGMPSNVKKLFMIKVTGAEPVPDPNG